MVTGFSHIAVVDDEQCYPTLSHGRRGRAHRRLPRSESRWLAVRGVEPPAGEDVPSIDELVPPRIQAVEMYEKPPQVPSRFRGLGTHYDVIVVWTTQKD